MTSKMPLDTSLLSVWQNLELCVKFTWIFSSKMLFFRGLPRKAYALCVRRLESVFCALLVMINKNTLWICKACNDGGFVILSVSEKSKEFKTRFEFMDTSLRSVWQTNLCRFKRALRAKNPHFKGAICILILWILRLTPQYDNVKGFLDTSLRSVWQNLELCVKFTWIFSSKMLFFRGLSRKACALLAMTRRKNKSRVKAL